MAIRDCQTCGRVWDSEREPTFTAREFSQPNFPVGSYLTVEAMLTNGEAILTCPSDPQEPLDSVIQENFSGPRSSARITGVNTSRSRFLP